MRRLLLSMMMVVFVVFAGGAAFAADIDTAAVVQAPDAPEVYGAALSGATTPTITSDLTAIQDMMGHDNGNLGRFLDELNTQMGSAAKVAMVSFGFAQGSTRITYNVSEGEYLYNFRYERFDNLSGGATMSAAEYWAQPAAMVAAAAVPVYFNAGQANDYDASSPDPTPSTGVRMLSVKETAMSDGGSGCSALSIAALALFLLPALGLIRRKK